MRKRNWRRSFESSSKSDGRSRRRRVRKQETLLESGKPRRKQQTPPVRREADSDGTLLTATAVFRTAVKAANG